MNLMCGSWSQTYFVVRNLFPVACGSLSNLQRTQVIHEFSCLLFLLASAEQEVQLIKTTGDGLISVRTFYLLSLLFSCLPWFYG